jgi:hypothetical protein
MPMVMGSIPANLQEQAVYRALVEQLPDDWWVLTNVAWSQREVDHNGASYVRDGQADFVVLAPGLGLLVIEVKGSRYVRIAEGQWYRSHDSKHWQPIEKKSPPEQACANAHEITDRIGVKFGKFRWPFGFIVAYPQGTILQGGFEAYDSSTFVLKSHMGDWTKRIRVALQARGDRGADFTADVARIAAHMLVNEGLTIGPAANESLPANAASAESRIIEQLTRQQAAALEGIFHYPRVAITGPAGSGKTVLAMWRLAALLAAGKTAIYLCFNKTLAEFLRLRNPTLASAIHHVDSYFGSVARNVSVAHKTPTFYDEELPGHVIDEVEFWSDDKKFDAVIVDEGQDFGEYRLWAARTLMRPEGTFLYCSDDRQDLYRRNTREAAGAEIVFSLVHNCRNTVRINETSWRVIDTRIDSMPGLPEGIETHVRVCDSNQMSKQAWELAGRWSNDGSRVAILSPFQLEKSSMATRLTGYNKRLVQALEEWDQPDAILFSTIKSFKGLEADAVIVVDVEAPRENTALDSGDLYVACTRGRARLALLCASETAMKKLTASAPVSRPITAKGGG